ncbi:transglutaminaseTgpA domain-containing protein [Massilia niabensis]|uniref:TransglutaminaseTgpA domain-containing protein n=1 Tax=Massilia niabensis TaxID=544910 RepID=A0ABW0LAR9_9BURK
MKALLSPLSRLAALPRDKADTLLLLASALLVLAPHTAHLPGWVSLLCGLTLLWRATITLQGKRMPSPVLLLPLAGLAMVGVSYTYQTLLGRDAGVAMLVLLVAFKMLEMHARRDLFVVVFLCFFLVLTNFFYEQGIGTALLMALSVLALLTAQMSFQFSGAVPPLRRRFLMSARILGLAAPLAAALFFLFPRLDGPLWGMPGDADSARSGLSETMAPGTMAHLARSGETAFRVRFDGPPPPQEQLYWRGPVLADYDGRTWTRVKAAAGPAPGSAPTQFRLALSVSGKPVGYEVTLEPQPSGSRWLFALEMPRRLPGLDGNLAQVSGEFELTAAFPVEARLRYRMDSFLSYRLQAPGVPGDAGQWLQLPGDSNPRALMAGLALRAEPDPRKRVVAVLNSFRREHYVYTLNPPLLGRHAVDDFLYGSRAGFCEHFAGSFVFLMRAAGVPARVVTGYQGGDLNPIDGYVTVRQSDAHAWAEVWLAGRGWVRVDPTAAVAPERVRRGLDEAIPPPAPFGLEGLGRLMRFDADSNPWLAQMRYAAGALNNGWNQWVLNYSPQRQRALADSLQSSLLDWRLPVALVAVATLLFLLRTLRRRQEIDPIDALYSALCARLARMGLARSADESPSVYAARIAAAAATKQLAPPVAAAAAEFLARYGAWRYAPRRNHDHLAATLKRLLSQVR